MGDRHPEALEACPEFIEGGEWSPDSRKTNMPWMYILECKDGSYYTGSTPNLERRVAEHKLGQGGRYTSVRLPVEIVFSYEVARIDDAFHLERQVKGWRRAKKEALIRGDYNSLVELSKSTRQKSEG